MPILIKPTRHTHSRKECLPVGCLRDLFRSEGTRITKDTTRRTRGGCNILVGYARMGVFCVFPTNPNRRPMKKTSFWLCASWLCAALIFAVALNQTIAQEYTSRAEVMQNADLRQDFILQGEYLGEIDGKKQGLHVIADGGSNFRIVLYQGGLPGDGWKRGDSVKRGTAKVEGDEISYTLDGREGKGKITIERRPQQQSARQIPGVGNIVKLDVDSVGYEKQNRRSPTLGAEAPADAIVIFDGTNLNRFQDGARMNEVPQREGQRRNPSTLWAEAATTAFEKRPYKMHLEFMLSYMPQARGQARSNSGVYIDERYELQILDSFGLEGNNDECGGFYQVSQPAVNMCFPPLTWQTCEIDFVPAQWDGDQKTSNARVSAWHNGVLIQDNVEFQRHTPGRKDEGPESMGVYLQGHGNKVQFRNIWIQYQDGQAASQEPEQSFGRRANRRNSFSGLDGTQPGTQSGIQSATQPLRSFLTAPIVVLESLAEEISTEVLPQRGRTEWQQRQEQRREQRQEQRQEQQRQPVFPRLRALFS